MPNSTIPAAATGLPAETDEALVFGIRLREALERKDALDQKSTDADRSGKHSARIYFNDAFTHATDEVDSIHEVIASVKVKSLAGAAVQIVEAFIRVGEIEDRADALVSKDEELPFELKRNFRMMERLLFSALDVITATFDGATAELINKIGSPYCNPWVPVEARCQELESAAPAGCGTIELPTAA